MTQTGEEFGIRIGGDGSEFVFDHMIVVGSEVYLSGIVIDVRGTFCVWGFKCLMDIKIGRRTYKTELLDMENVYWTGLDSNYVVLKIEPSGQKYWGHDTLIFWFLSR